VVDGASLWKGYKSASLPTVLADERNSEFLNFSMPLKARNVKIFKVECQLPKHCWYVWRVPSDMAPGPKAAPG
jgi:hypothetical protein